MEHLCLIEDRQTMAQIIQELQGIGCCDLCIVRYLGVNDHHVYTEEKTVKKILTTSIAEDMKTDFTDVDDEEGYSCPEKGTKQLKRNTCVACLGLLQDGIKSIWVDKIAYEISQKGIEAMSYCTAISLPICMQIRAYSIWFHLKKKFGDLLIPIESFKPDGVSVKAAWKWLYSYALRQKVDPNSEWGNSALGAVRVDITLDYQDDIQECTPLQEYITRTSTSKKRSHNKVSRGAVEAKFKDMEEEEFFKSFQCPPSIPTASITVGTVECFHGSIFVAGRYCKYSRDLSQTPWKIDSVRRTESSIEELISRHLLPAFGTTASKFSSSGREDVDVRTLGKGRPFVVEILNPKKTLFSLDKMKSLNKQINSTTNLISVRDIQIVDKKDLGELKHGEQSKSKVYCALCILPGRIVTEEHLKILNECPLPIRLKQKTPVRVLHRRSLATRDRCILEMTAIPIKNNSELFKLFVRTEAGTYVKEFVHGDFGRTKPNVKTILGVDADIVALDVMEVALDWPPELD